MCAGRRSRGCFDCAFILDSRLTTHDSRLAIRLVTHEKLREKNASIDRRWTVQINHRFCI